MMDEPVTLETSPNKLTPSPYYILSPNFNYTSLMKWAPRVVNAQNWKTGSAPTEGTPPIGLGP